MLTSQDIRNVIAAFKEVFATKENFDKGMGKMTEALANLQAEIEAFSKPSNKKF